MSEFPLPPGELERLESCVLEPIRFPGGIQPHGALLALGSHFVITHASENTAAILGAEPVALFGRSVADVVGTAGVDAINAVLDPESIDDNPVLITLGGVPFELVVHDIDGRIVLEFEPGVADVQGQTAVIRAAMRRATNARTVEELWADTTLALRKITGFDRVMAYHFHSDGHGEVVGEAKADDMEPYLGLHYPPSDIPAQARQLYLTKLSRMIVDSSAVASPLLADANQPDVTSLDLSLADLRAVSPHHLEFMRNMGQVSTFSLSIVRNGVLVGMITCAHRSVRTIPYGVRDGLEIFANQIALQLGSMMEIARLDRRNAIREIRSVLLRQVAGSDDLAAALLHGRVTVRDLVPADGAAIRLGDRVERIGIVPDSDFGAVGRAVTEAVGSLRFASGALSSEFPQVAALVPGVAGLLVQPLGNEGDFIAWTRGEVAQTVTWLGDMSADNRPSPLSPRYSFSAWTQEVVGTSARWEDAIGEARELGRDLDSALLQRAESQLAALALHDALTGLPNRRLLMERLERALSRERSTGVAILFIDLDRFKEINDTFGHAEGDAALVRIADALQRAARKGDTVARHGGDEFIVLCENTSPEVAVRVAERMLKAIDGAAQPSDPWHITASVGIALADGSMAPAQLLIAADAAMYRAKAGGRNQASD